VHLGVWAGIPEHAINLFNILFLTGQKEASLGGLELLDIIPYGIRSVFLRIDTDGDEQDLFLQIAQSLLHFGQLCHIRRGSRAIHVEKVDQNHPVSEDISVETEFFSLMSNDREVGKITPVVLLPGQTALRTDLTFLLEPGPTLERRSEEKECEK
jgi:hypothetical protein